MLCFLIFFGEPTCGARVLTDFDLGNLGIWESVFGWLGTRLVGWWDRMKERALRQRTRQLLPNYSYFSYLRYQEVGKVFHRKKTLGVRG